MPSALLSSALPDVSVIGDMIASPVTSPDAAPLNAFIASASWLLSISK